MEKKSMIPNETRETNPEQLLKLLEMQVAMARERRAAREAGRSHAGKVGLFIIVAGAAFALWMLTVLLDQMRSQHGERKENASASPAERVR
ncbi:MAG: hypothetical protein NTV08_04590 [Verrucomicrobia bacterium]|nr:hypothetical protein [Verrucomicrobiota bacterium]